MIRQIPERTFQSHEDPRTRELFPRFICLTTVSFGCDARRRGTAKACAEVAGTPPYKDANLPIADRVKDLLGRMTLEEKVDQLYWGWIRKDRT